VRLARELRALAGLRAVCEQAQARARAIVDDAIVGGTEYTELRELRWLGLDVGARIAEHQWARGGRQHGHDRGTLDTRQPAEHEQRCREHRAAVACGHDGFALARRDPIDRDTHRRVGLLAKHLARVVVRRHDPLACDREPIVLAFACEPASRRTRCRERHLGSSCAPRLATHRRFRTGRAITTHRIDNDPHAAG
jgi:hypothetical protein